MNLHTITRTKRQGRLNRRTRSSFGVGVKLIFDFDHTLFSAKKLYFAIREAFIKIGVEEKLFQETFEKSKGRGRDYKPTIQFRLIKKARSETSLKKLEKALRRVLDKVPEFLYPDTIWFLKRWRDNADSILLSYGEEKFQKDKIKASKIGKYFEKIIITRDINKLKPFKRVFQNRKKAIFVEDNPTALAKIKKTFKKVITVRINRGEGKYTKLPNDKNIDFSIKNLRQLDRILKKN
jgi:FMN phosphatase YigB (HAD superfamily)